MFCYQTFDSLDVQISAEVRKFKLHQERGSHGKGFVLMNLSKNKRWRVLLHRVIAKQQSIREENHPVCLLEVEKYEKVESVNIQNDYKTLSKK